MLDENLRVKSTVTVELTVQIFGRDLTVTRTIMVAPEDTLKHPIKDIGSALQREMYEQLISAYTEITRK